MWQPCIFASVAVEEPVFSAICGAGALPHERMATRCTRRLQSGRRSEANQQCPDVASNRLLFTPREHQII